MACSRNSRKAEGKSPYQPCERWTIHPQPHHLSSYSKIRAAPQRNLFSDRTQPIGSHRQPLRLHRFRRMVRLRIKTRTMARKHSNGTPSSRHTTQRARHTALFSGQTITFCVFLCVLSMLVITALAPTTTGQEVMFPVNQQNDTKARSTVDATRVLNTTYFSFWGETTWWNSLTSQEAQTIKNQAKLLARTFRQNDLQAIRNFFGESFVEIKRIPVLLVPMKDKVSSYVVEQHETDAQQNDFYFHNQATIYLNTRTFSHHNTQTFLSVGFSQIMLAQQQNSPTQGGEQQMIRTLIANAIPAIANNATYAEHYTKEFLQNPFSPHSDAWIVLFAYFIAHNIDQSVLTTFANSRFHTTETLNDALQQHNTTDTFQTLFERWNTILFVNGTLTETRQKQAYAFKNEVFKTLRIPTSKQHSLNQKTTVTINPYSSQWIQYTPSTLGISESNTALITIATREELLPYTIPYTTTSISGKKTLHSHTLTTPNESIPIRLFGTYILSASFFLPNATPRTRSITIHTHQHTPIQDGTIITSTDNTQLFVVKGNTKRLIPSLTVFESYQHLTLDVIQQVHPSVLDFYTQSFLIQQDNDPRVWEIDEQGTKHWLDMTPEQFEKSGRKWNHIFTVNNIELNWYTEGEPYSYTG